MKTMNRNWPEFWSYSFKSLKYSAIAMTLVPVYFVFMNPNWDHPRYFSEMLRSARIGVQISLFYWFLSTLIYLTVQSKNPALLIAWKQSIFVQAVMGLSLMAIALGLTSYFEPKISGNTFGLGNVMIGLLVGGITFLLSLFVVGYRKTKEHNLKLRAQSAEANLNVLKNQMQPHFLFNSLNTLAELIESDQGAASTMTQKLSDLYREILINSQTPMTSIESELSIIQKYLELEKLRFGERLRYKISQPEDMQRAFLPSLTLQTLVENAVKHGISQSVAGGEIHISLRKEPLGYSVEIVNSGCGFAKTKNFESSAGTGIVNTRARLELLYGAKHQFRYQVENNRTAVSFWFSGALLGE